MKAKTWKRRAVYAVAILLSIVTFTPLVIPHGTYEPWFLGMPRTLWMGILITIALVFITFLAGRYSPEDIEEQDGAAEFTDNDRRRS